MEPCAKKITRKNNPILVAAVFRLMFETLWIPPYDRRRCNALVADFDLCARSAVTRLAATDLAAASGIELDEMRYAVECLLRSIERLDAARLLPPERCAEPWNRCAALLPGCVNGVPTRCEMSNAWYGFRCPALPSRNRDGRLLLTR